MKRTCLVLFCSALSALSASAQLNLTRTGGTIGKTLELSVAGTPNELFLLIPSTNAGPTPLPNDTRFLEVGLDLFSIAALGVLQATPSKVPLPIPDVPGFAGITLHFHALTFPGTVRFADDVSNPVRQVLGVANKWLNRGKVLTGARGMATLSKLASGNYFLAAGGEADFVTLNFKAVNTTELYDADRQRFTAGPNLATARVGHRGVTLANGKVLICGGVDNLGNPLSSCELYDPTTNKVAPTGAMRVARFGHTATLLTNGKVLVTGGTANTADTVALLNAMQRSTELYDPATQTWSAGPNLGRHRMLHAAIRLNDGRVLISGGLGYINLIFIKIPTTVGNCDQINAAGTSRGSTGSHRAARLAHELTLLPSGRVLATGGANLQNFTNVVTIADAEEYNGSSWSATANKLPTAVAGHTTQILQDGRVLIMGGLTGSLTTATTTVNCALYNTGTRSFSAAAALATRRALAASMVVPGGQVVIVGGGGGALNKALDSAERFFQ